MRESIDIYASSPLCVRISDSGLAQLAITTSDDAAVTATAVLLLENRGNIIMGLLRKCLNLLVDGGSLNLRPCSQLL